MPSLYRAGVQLAVTPLKGALAVANGGLAAERRARAALSAASAAAALDALDGVLARLLTDEVVGRVLERVEASGVAQRVARRVLEDGIAAEIAALAIDSPELERMLGAAFESERTQQALTRGLESDAVERLLDRMLRSPGSERLVALMIKSPLPQEIVSGLLASEQLWILVDEIARSPSVTEAISHQGKGFVDELAEGARGRSRSADAWVDRVARRLARQRDGSLPDANKRSPPRALSGADPP